MSIKHYSSHKRHLKEREENKFGSANGVKVSKYKRIKARNEKKRSASDLDAQAF